MLISLALSSAALADDLYEKKEPVAFTFMQKIAPSQTVGEYPILTLGNQWSLFHSKVGRTNLGGAMANVNAMDARDGKFFASLDMSANLQEINSGDWTDEPCKPTHFLYKNGEGFRNINCATVNYNTSFFVNPKGDFQTYLAQFRQMNIEFPPPSFASNLPAIRTGAVVWFTASGLTLKLLGLSAIRKRCGVPIAGTRHSLNATRKRWH